MCQARAEDKDEQEKDESLDALLGLLPDSSGGAKSLETGGAGQVAAASAMVHVVDAGQAPAGLWFMCLKDWKVLSRHPVRCLSWFSCSVGGVHMFCLVMFCLVACHVQQHQPYVSQRCCALAGAVCEN